ncbi:phage portal protein [Saccharibacter floricola]|uniref:Bacteriophage capsid structural protein n=1 Tax=Saccharibacter floricola DSM 15669 TaxID=1123227 RepID=A0ABQ0P0E7_9PROT|nr:phage portal protein [Saccharibacter floricola]GBQ08029.1 bacteriophage capsid structural protein [Saccharibacter floricola DSM 15669]
MAILSPRRAALQRGRRAAPKAPARPRPMGLHNPSNMPYDGADYYGQHNQQWMPGLRSGDSTIGASQRDTLVARMRDLVRNDGWASGAVTRILDSVVGVSLRPVSKPDHRWLRHVSGNSRFDASWAAEFSSFIDAHWRNWADDPSHYNDTERQLTFSQQMHLAMRHLLIDGDALAVLPWLEERVCLGGARYATSVQIVDTDRLSNPDNQYDLSTIRNGVEVDPITGEPIAYHIREAHPDDYFAVAQSTRWARYPKETAFGRPITVHHFERHQAGQHRGGAGIFAPVITRMKMLARYDTAELDAAIVNAVFAAFIETPYDPQSTAEALGATSASEALGNPAGWAGWDERVAYHDGRNLSLQGSRIPMLSPGEKITSVTAARPASGFADFEKTVLRNVASAAGLSPMQVSNDWSDVNYSSARAALLEAYKTTDRRRLDFCAGFAVPIRLAWLEEAMESDRPPMPTGGAIPHFLEARHAYGRVKWLGPGRGWIDPTKEREGALIGVQSGLSTLEDEAAMNEGRNWEDILDQRKIEQEAFQKAGLRQPGDSRPDEAVSHDDSENSGDSNE